MLGNAFVVIPFRYYTGQYFAYLIVLDLESTCWKDKKMNYGPEISKLKTKILWLHCPDKSMSREPMRTNMPLSLIDQESATISPPITDISVTLDQLCRWQTNALLNVNR